MCFASAGLIQHFNCQLVSVIAPLIANVKINIKPIMWTSVGSVEVKYSGQDFNHSNMSDSKACDLQHLLRLSH